MTPGKRPFARGHRHSQRVSGGEVSGCETCGVSGFAPANECYVRVHLRLALGSQVRHTGLSQVTICPPPPDESTAAQQESSAVDMEETECDIPVTHHRRLRLQLKQNVTLPKTDREYPDRTSTAGTGVHTTLTGPRPDLPFQLPGWCAYAICA